MQEVTKAAAINAADVLAEYLVLKRINVVDGGPSVADPMGEICRYLGFLDKHGNGCYIGLDEHGKIIRCGGTVEGRRAEFPTIERL